MMILIEITVIAEPKSIKNLLRVTARLGAWNGGEALLAVTGEVRSADGVLLTTLHETELGAVGRSELRADPPNGNTPFIAILVGELSDRALDHIENVRHGTKKRDVVLSLRLYCRSWRSKVSLSPVVEGPEVQPRDGRGPGNALAYRYLPGGDHRAEKTSLWLLSGNGSPVYGEVNGDSLSGSVTISASDYVHDYLPVWRGGSFIVFDVPQPQVEGIGAELGEKLQSALNDAVRARENLMKGEWSDVVEGLRGVWEVARNDAAVEALLTADGYTPAAIADLNKSLQAQFDFASKFLHRMDRGKRLSPEIRASREDAQMVYAIAMSFLNLVARKAHKQRSV